MGKETSSKFILFYFIFYWLVSFLNSLLPLHTLGSWDTLKVNMYVATPNKITHTCFNLVGNFGQLALKYISFIHLFWGGVKTHGCEVDAIFCSKLMSKYIRKNHLSKNNKDVHMLGSKHRTTISKATPQQPQLWMFVFYVCQPTNQHICVIVQSNACHIGGWNRPKVMHKSKYS